MAVEGLDAGEELAVVADGDEDLVVGADGGVEDAQGPGGELMLFELRDLVLPIPEKSLSVTCGTVVRRWSNWGGEAERQT